MSPQVRLVPVGPEHEAAVQEYASDPLVGEMTLVPHPYPPGGARDFIAAATRRRSEGKEWVFAILEGEDFRGLVGVLAHEDPVRHGEVGYWIGKPFRGKGLATRAAALVVDFAFREAGLPFLRSFCLERNPASARVLEKAGFTNAGPYLNENPKWPPEEPFRAYSLSRAAWEGSHRSSTPSPGRAC